MRKIVILALIAFAVLAMARAGPAYAAQTTGGTVFGCGHGGRNPESDSGPISQRHRTGAVLVTCPSRAAVLAVFVALASTIVFVPPGSTIFDSTMLASVISVTFDHSSLVLLSPIVITIITIVIATGMATRGYVDDYTY